MENNHNFCFTHFYDWIFQAAQAVLIALFNLNSPEFSMMLSVLPKTFQVIPAKYFNHDMLKQALTYSSLAYQRKIKEFPSKPSFEKTEHR